MPRKPMNCEHGCGEPIIVKSTVGDAKLLILEDKMQEKLVEELVSKINIGKIQVGTKYEAGTSLEVIIRDMLSPDEKLLASIRVATPPTKVSYSAGEVFNKAGMVVEAVYSDATTEVVNDYTYSPTTPLTVNDTKITIAYNGKTVNQPITVVESGIKIYKGVCNTKPTTAAEIEALTKDEKSKAILLNEAYSVKRLNPDNQFVILAIPKDSGLYVEKVLVNGFSIGILETEVDGYYMYSEENPATLVNITYDYYFSEV